MNRYVITAAIVTAALTSACGGGESGQSGKSAKAAAEKPAIGRCAVDARDGAPYGKITAESVDSASGDRMYRIETKAATWNKKAGNVRVVDCP